MNSDKFRSSHPEVLLGKGVLKINSKFTGDHPSQQVKVLCNFIEITLRHRCSFGVQTHAVKLQMFWNFRRCVFVRKYWLNIFILIYAIYFGTVNTANYLRYKKVLKMWNPVVCFLNVSFQEIVYHIEWFYLIMSL